MSGSAQRPCTAFRGSTRIAAGDFEQVAQAARMAHADGDSAQLVLVFHDQNNIGPLDVCRMDCLYSAARCASRSYVHSRVVSIDRFRSWTSPLVLAAYKQNIDSIHALDSDV